MAPPKVMLGQNRQNNNTMGLRKGMTTRSQNAVLNNIFKHTNVIRDTRIKRKAEASPIKEKTNKRHAFANITNAITTSLTGQNTSKKSVTHVKSFVECNVIQKCGTNVQKLTINGTQKLATSAAQKSAISTAQKSATIAAQKSATNVTQKFTTNATQKATTNVVQKLAINVAQKSGTNITQKSATNITQKSMTNTTCKPATNIVQKSSTDVIEKISSNITDKMVLMNTSEKFDTEKSVTVAKINSIKSKLRATKSIIKKDEKIEMSNKNVNIRYSIDLENSEDNSLYMSALEDITNMSTRKTRRSYNNKIEENEKRTEKDNRNESVSPIKEISTISQLSTIPETKLPEGVEWDFDNENWLDPYQVPHYAMDIFEYLKKREQSFCISNYMERQVCLSIWMRALLVDWMVEVQESFELNHETLYLAVKLVDLYLSKVTVSKETLQLLGAASLFISSKYDERIPPMVEDFLYICDGAYTQNELIRMEMNVLRVINFDLGVPLSYRFLRRYARCAKLSMSILTLARYILEYCLMDYSLITSSDSKMAAAALLLALLMKDQGGWTPTLEYYSGYKLEDIRDTCNLLNESLHKKYTETLLTIRNKYSHKIFFEVAKLPLKETLDI